MGLIEISETYNRFLRHLSNKSGSLAPLQLTGLLEDYLVHEFIVHVYKETRGEILGITNLGNKGERKYDIAFIKNNLMGNREIVSAFEAKYITNAHKLRKEEDAIDNIGTTLKSLSKQLKNVITNKHGGYPVVQEAVGSKLYGLVFASCRKSSPGNGTKSNFFDNQILDRAKKMGFTRYGSNEDEPIFNDVYEDIEVRAVGYKYYLTLKVGLWQSSESED
ncbi:MAG: hypothetical protein RE469_04275 [Cuniculiplasma divulgatum]|jgi:hypothetical protein|nr:MAG: hypothetical protein RE469_04275 [Cuniculiplasma divulgatum]